MKHSDINPRFKVSRLTLRTTPEALANLIRGLMSASFRLERRVLGVEA